MPFRPFMFATGIENSYPVISDKNGNSLRIDEMQRCGHYEHWQEDFNLVKEMGIRFLRYGPPIHTTWLGPGKYNWDFADQTMNALKSMDIVPIVDLCHFGVPDHIGNFQNPDFPKLFAEYAKAFAARFPWVRMYTPVNEIFVAATFSALLGWWNERLTSDKAFVTAMKNLSMANILAMHAILEVQKDPAFIQSESTEYFHDDGPKASSQAGFLNSRRFLSLDLTYGHPVELCIYEHLLDNGMTRDEYHWFGKNHVKARCIMGNDYYITNEHLVNEDNSVDPSGEIFGYYVITHQYFARYRLPVMHTETNLANSEGAPNWLRKEWANLHRLKKDGVPILGFTWYSLTDQIDWDTALREVNNRVNPCGLYDLDRKIRPVGTAYKKLIAQWSEILPTESFGLRTTY